MAAQERTGERGRDRVQEDRAAAAPEPTPNPDTADTDTAHTGTTDDPDPDPKPDATAPDPEIDRLKGQLAQARHIVTDLLVRAEKRTEAYDSRIAVLEQTIVQYRTDTEKLRNSLRSATDKLTALTECTVAVPTGTGTQTELAPELTPRLTPELAQRTACTDCTGWLRLPRLVTQTAPTDRRSRRPMPGNPPRKLSGKRCTRKPTRRRARQWKQGGRLCTRRRETGVENVKVY